MKTIQDLFEYATKRYFFSEDQVRNLMKTHNILYFNPEDDWLYSALLRNLNNEIQLQKEMPDCCPICGAKVMRCVKNDRMFGATCGWNCMADKHHFLRARMQILQKMCEKKYEIQNNTTSTSRTN